MNCDVYLHTCPCTCIYICNMYSVCLSIGYNEGGFCLSGENKDEENAIMNEGCLFDLSVMADIKEQFIADHNALLALSTHGPM